MCEKLRKWCHIALVLLLMVGLFSLPVQAADASVTLSSAEADPGDEVALTVSLDGNPGVTVMRLQLTYDTSVLTLTEVEDAGKLGQAMHSDSNDAMPFMLYWKNSTSKKNYTANGTIVTLRFKVNEDALYGECPVEIRFDDTDILNADLDKVAFNCISGMINISCTHSRAEWELTVPSTCTVPGEAVLICPDCGKELETRDADLAPHKIDWIVDREATLTKTGLRHGTCTVCNQLIEEEIPKRVTAVTAESENGDVSVTVTVDKEHSLPGDTQLSIQNVVEELTDKQRAAWNDAVTRLAPDKELAAVYSMCLLWEDEPYQAEEAMTVTVTPAKDLNRQYGEWQWLFDGALVQTNNVKSGAAFETTVLNDVYALAGSPVSIWSYWWVILVAVVITAAITIAILFILKRKRTKRERA